MDLKKADLLHMRSGADPKVLQPQPFTVRIIPAVIQAQIDLLEKQDGEYADIVGDAVKKLRALRDDAPVFNAFFRPFKLRELTNYSHDKVDKLTIIQRHVTHADGTPYFSEEEVDALRDETFVQCVHEALYEQSGVVNDLKKKSAAIMGETMLAVEKRRSSKKPRSTSAANDESLVASSLSSPRSTVSSPGRSRS